MILKLSKEKFDDWLKNGQKIKLPDLLRIGGRAVASYLRQWFFDMDAQRPNQLGGKRTHFYADVARSVGQPKVSATQAEIDIRHVGILQRWLGGIIRPVLAKYLAIPARAEAYGKTPREFSDLHFVPTGRGGFLAQNLQTGVRKTKKGFKSAGESGGLAMFWLVKEVDQKPDPSVMPTETKLVEVLDNAITGYLRTKLQVP